MSELSGFTLNEVYTITDCFNVGNGDPTNDNMSYVVIIVKDSRGKSCSSLIDISDNTGTKYKYSFKLLSELREEELNKLL